VDRRWSSYSRSYTKCRRGHISYGQSTNQDRLPMYSTCTPGHRVQPCFHTYAHATRTHTRTHSKLKIPVTPRTTQFSHQGNLHARIAVYPRSNRPRTGKRSSEGQNVLGSLVKCYHFVLGLSAIQVHTHTHTHTHTLTAFDWIYNQLKTICEKPIITN